MPSSVLSSDAPIFLMDGSAYVYRGFFANRGLQTAQGFPTGSLVVVSRILLRILRQKSPRWFAFVLDGKGRNFRHDIYGDYKANREAMPEDLACQLDPIRRMVQALGIHLEVSEGCEADDCIASLAARLSKEHPVVIVSGDKDLKQCLGPNVTMWDPGAKVEKIVTAEDFEKEIGVAPALWADMQALIGDAVDNIPGVPGIGPKTASQIFELCPGLEAIRDHFALLPPKLQKKLDGHLEEMFLWRRLTRLSTEQVPGLSLDDLAVKPVDGMAARRLANEFELMAVGRDLEDLIRDDALLRQGRRQAAGREVRHARPEEIPWDVEEDAAPMDRTAAETSAQEPLRRAESMEEDRSSAAAPEKGKAARGMTGLGMGSLLDLTPQVELRSLASVEALPDCRGARVALIWESGREKGCSVALLGRMDGLSGKGAQEFSWKGDREALARWGAQAAVLVVEDAKRIMETAPEWRGELMSRALAGEGLFDLSLAAYLFDPEDGDYSWKRLSKVARATDPEGTGLGAGALALGLEARDRARLARDAQTELYFQLEMPLMAVLADMEKVGIGIDRDAFADFLREAQETLAAITRDIHDAAGVEFNIRSSQQLGELLFTRLGLPQPRKKTKGGQASTNQEVLERLAGMHPVVDAVLRYRKMEKLRGTYLEPLPRLADGKGRIHTTFNQLATATGRLSSRNPNLQNIPVRGDFGRRMRSCFRASEGSMLVSCDYSQVELRVLAHMSGDPALVDAFRNGEDIHARTAALVYDLEPAGVTPDQRRNAKTINFGLIYGMGATKLSQELHIPTAEAKEFIGRYFERLSGLKAFYEGVEQRAREDGYVTTLGGRRRLLPDIRSGSGQLYAMARRQAVNTVIQGSAADIIKIAMLKVWRDEELRRMGARMVLQIHDELLIEVPEAYAEETGRRVASLMEAVEPGGEKFSVPLLVDWGSAADWGGAH